MIKMTLESLETLVNNYKEDPTKKLFIRPQYFIVQPEVLVAAAAKLNMPPGELMFLVRKIVEEANAEAAR